MKVCCDHLPLPAAAAAVGGGHGAGARLAVPGDQAVLRGAGHRQGPDGVGVAVTVAVVVVSTSVATRPHEDAATPLAAIGHALYEGSGGEIARTVNCLAVIIRTP